MNEELNKFLLFLNEQDEAYGESVLGSIAQQNEIDINIENCIHESLARNLLLIIPSHRGIPQYLLRHDIKKIIATLPREFEGRPYDYLLDVERNAAEREAASKWYNTENAKKQFEDYPQTKNLAKLSFLISVGTFIIAIAALIVSIVKRS